MAMGRTHALSGFAAALVAAAATGAATGTASLPGVAAAGVLCAGAALMPDWDHPQATVARTFGPATKALCAVVEKVSLGHRKLTHSLAGVAVFTALAWGAQALAGAAPAGTPLPRLRELPLLALLALLAGPGLRALRVGGFRRERVLGAAALGLSTVLAYAMLRFTPEVMPLVPWIVALGCLTHIAFDMLTEGGCPVLAPLVWRDYWLSPKMLRWQTTDREGLIPERHLVTPALWLVIGLACWWIAGDSGLVHR